LCDRGRVVGRVGERNGRRVGEVRLGEADLLSWDTTAVHLNH